MSRAEISRVLFNILFGPYLHTSLKKNKNKKKEKKKSDKKEWTEIMFEDFNDTLENWKGKSTRRAFRRSGDVMISLKCALLPVWLLGSQGFLSIVSFSSKDEEKFHFQSFNFQMRMYPKITL